MDTRDRGWLKPLFWLIVALTLSVVPLPGAVAAFRPDWVAVVLLYWSLISPRRFGMMTAFWMGIGLDTLSGALLGQHALALLIIVYLSQRFHLRIRAFPASQQAATVVGLLALYEFVLFWIDGVAGRTVPAIERWAPVLSGAVLWTLIVYVTSRGRQESHARV
jgi:rod shape-determining protein MreD